MKEEVGYTLGFFYIYIYIYLHLSRYLTSFSGLKHGSNIPVSYPGFELWIHDPSCRLLGFLSALTQMGHSATVGPCRFTDVDIET